MSDEFKFDIFTKGSVADIPVTIQKAHTRLYEHQQNFKYKISSECQVISTCTKTMIDLCSRMQKCVDSLSNIRDDMIKISNYTLALDSSNDDYADLDVVYDIRWIQNLSFRSYKLIKDKIFIDCFKLIFIDAVNKFKHIESNAGDNIELLKELESNKNIYFKILIPNLYKELIAELDYKSDFNDVIRALLIVIAMEIYTGGDVKYVKNLYINCRSILIESLTDIDQLINAMKISYMGLEIFNLKLSGGKHVEPFKKFSSTSNIVLSDVKYISTTPNWLDVVSQKLCDMLFKSSNFNDADLINKNISIIENENFNDLSITIEGFIADLGLESKGKINFDPKNIVSTKIKSITDILVSYIPKIITKWLKQSFDYTIEINSRLSGFFESLNKLNELLDKTNSLDKFKGEFSKNLNKLNKLITADLDKLTEITFDNVQTIVNEPCISNIKFLDILASKYIFDQDYCGQHFGEELISSVKKFTTSINNLFKIKTKPSTRGPRMELLSQLLIRSRFISFYVINEQQLIVKNIIGYKAFTSIKIASIQDAIDSEFMLLKYNEYMNDELRVQIITRLGLERIEFETLDKYQESKEIALDAHTSTRYMFPGITHPINKM